MSAVTTHLNVCILKWTVTRHVCDATCWRVNVLNILKMVCINAYPLLSSFPVWSSNSCVWVCARSDSGRVLFGSRSRAARVSVFAWCTAPWRVVEFLKCTLWPLLKLCLPMNPSSVFRRRLCLYGSMNKPEQGQSLTLTRISLHFTGSWDSLVWLPWEYKMKD